MADSADRLRDILRWIDGKGFGFYKDIRGSYAFPNFHLTVSHVQSDVFAPPSRMRITIPFAAAGWSEEYIASPVRRIAFEDRIARAFRDAAAGGRPTNSAGKGGRIEIACNGQAVLARNSVLASTNALEIRFAVGLPAQGRRILGGEAERLLLGRLPEIVNESLFASSIPAEDMQGHVESLEDQAFLRDWLVTKGAVAFVADGSILPRRSGIDDRPLPADHGDALLVRFRSPDALAANVDLPNGGPVRGMLVPPGVTLIVGGGFHGKSTLLGAITRGVYNHVPGDGRQRVVTDPTAVKIRAEDGRSIASADLRPLIGTLPFGRETADFSTQNASGSTSQAAGIMEALESGARVLLMDEDTCATNMMIRDVRMRRLVPDDREPITPFVDKIRALYRQHGVSTVLVMGGAGDYFRVADTVIMMDSYAAKDVTTRAREIGAASVGGEYLPAAQFGSVQSRRPDPASLDPSRGRKQVAVDAKGVGTLRYGEQTVDLGLLEQLIDVGQTRAIGAAILRLADGKAGRGNLRECLQKIADDVDREGLDILDQRRDGVVALPRVQEMAAAINRIRSLRISTSGP